MKNILIFILILTFSCRPKAQDDILIRNVSLISMEKDTIITHSDVLISKGRIIQIGKGLQSNSNKVKIIDGTNKYLMPGLADMHLHLWGDSTALRLYVANGVTSIKSMSGKPEYLKWAKQIQSGDKLGPQLYVSSPLMNDISFMKRYVPRPLLSVLYGLEEIHIPTIQLAAKGEVVIFSKDWAVRRQVKRAKKIGYNSLKPYVSMSQYQFVTMLEEANKQNIPVVGHIPSRVRIDDVIKYKMAGLAHVEELRYLFYKGYDFSGNTKSFDLIDTTGLNNITKRLKKAGIFVTSTIVACKDYNDRQKSDSAFFSNPAFKYVPPKTVELFRKHGGLTKEQYPEKEYWLLTTMLKSCHKNGVMIVLGTDSQWKTDVHGFTVHDELKILVDNGFTNYEAIETATKNAAISVNAINDWGTIKEGKRADLLLLDKNPLENINNTRAITGVCLNGKWFDKIALDLILENLRNFQINNDREISPY